MLIHLAGFLLGLAVTIHFIIIYLVYRNRNQSFFVPLFVYLNVLILLDEVCVIFFLDVSNISFAPLAARARFILEVFIPPVFYLLSENLFVQHPLPKLRAGTILFFVASLLFSLFAFTNVLITGIREENGILYPGFSGYFWFFILYFLTAYYLVFVDLIKKYHASRRKQEVSLIKSLVIYLLPASLVGFLFLHLGGYLGFVSPVLFLTYPLFTLLLFAGAIQSQLIEYSSLLADNILFLVITAVYGIFTSFIPGENHSLLYLVMVPVILFSFVITKKSSNFLRKKIKDHYEERDYSLEEELESFLSEIGKFIDTEEWARYLVSFAIRVFKCTKCAVVVSRFDFQPYQIVENEGFEATEIERLLSSGNSPVMEHLEIDQTILNKFDFSPEQSTYQALERVKIYLGIPLVIQNSLKGFVFIGGERKITRFSKKDLQFARVLSVQAATVLQNIQAIQNAVQAQKMAELGILASQLAHDFQSFITLVKLETPPENRARQYANYMERLVQDLLNYARPQDLKLSPININLLIDMTLDLVNIPGNIIVEKHYSESIPAVIVDGNQMRRVFANLFENSIRSMSPDGGRLKITTRPLRPLSKIRQSPWTYIEILDEGNGIPEEFLEKIFEPFFTTHKNEGGNGMGLAIVRQIITRHKGFIDVTSKPGKGTIFNIRLPILIR